MDDVVALRELDQIAKVLLVACTPSALHVRGIGWAGDLGKGQVFAANVHIALGVAGVQGELGRAGFDGLKNHVAVKAHPLGARFHVGARLFQDGARLFVHEIHAHFFQNRERRVVDRLELVLRHHGRGRKAVLEIAVFGGGGRNADVAAAAPSASAGRGCRRCCFFCHEVSLHVEPKRGV